MCLNCLDNIQRMQRVVFGSEHFFVNFSGFFCEFSCFFLLFLWFSEHALLVLPVGHFFVNFFWFFFVNFLVFSCFSCGFQNMPSWFCLSSSSGENSFLCIFLVFLVNFAGFQLPMASQRHRVSGTGPNLNVLQQHITSNPSSFCNSRLEHRGGHRWPR